MTPPDLKIVDLPRGNSNDAVSSLRSIADAIEAGEYGAVGASALVVLGDQMEVFGFGADREACSIGMLLHSGFLRMSKAIEGHGRNDT